MIRSERLLQNTQRPSVERFGLGILPLRSVEIREVAEAERDGGKRKERITAIMVDYGIPGGDSSMARTVSLPAAIGTRMLLEGKIQLRGVQIPVVADIYDPVLEELERMGIGFTETRQKL